MITKADIALIKSLADKKARAEHGIFVVEGPKLVGEALGSGLRVRRVIGTAEFSQFAGFEKVSRKDIERMSSLKTPQGVLAVVEIPQPTPIPDLSRNLILALDGIQDPGNLGTIIRIADWFGIGSIICSADSADCFNPKTVQASMGAIFRVKVSYETRFAERLCEFAQCGATVYGAFLDGENIYTADLGSGEPSGIIVIGNEGNGISPDVTQVITHRISIPSYPAGEPSSESLNVAAATAVICSEFRRPR